MSRRATNAAAPFPRRSVEELRQSPRWGQELPMNIRNISISPPLLAPAKGVTASTAARTKLLLEGPILPTLLRLAAPNILTLLAFAGVITFDGFFLGRIGTNALAGASLAFPWVMMVLQTTNSGMGAGVSSAVARALGAGRRDRADALVFHAFLLALAIAAILSTMLLIGAPFMFEWMGGRDEMLADALAYADVALGGAVVICVSNLLGNTVRGTGNMSFPAAVLIGCAIMIWYLRSRAIVRLNFRGVTPRWELFADILKVGVPGLINIAITNLSVVVLTGIAGQLGRDTALGYAMGARLEYIQQPVAFGFGTAIVAMVGTNWGARQYRRAREIAWTGATTIAVLCGTIGLIVAFHPGLWIGLFSDDADVARLGTLYLRIVGPAYLLFGLGLGLFYVTLGVGRAVAAMNANAVRMVVSASGGPVAIYWFDLGVAGFFAAVAAGFCLYAALLVNAVFSVKTPNAALATTSERSSLTWLCKAR